MASNKKIPGRHPNQDRWDARRAEAATVPHSTDQRRTNLKRAEARVEAAPNPSARRTAEIQVEAWSRSLDGRSGGRRR